MNVLSLTSPADAGFLPGFPAGSKRRSTTLASTLSDWKRAHGVSAYQRVFALAPLPGARRPPTTLAQFAAQHGLPGGAPSAVAEAVSPLAKLAETLRQKEEKAADAADETAPGGAEDVDMVKDSPSVGSSSSSQGGGAGGKRSKSESAAGGTPSSPSSSAANKPAGYDPTGPLDAIRKHLLSMGWVENKDPKSQYYDFKFALSRRDLGIRPSMLSQSRNTLPPDACLNFLGCTGGLTTKNGIARNFDKLIPDEGERIKAGVSQSFDMSEMKSTLVFVDSFQKQHCRTLLYRYVMGELPPEAELQLKIALNVVSNPRAYANGGISKEYWRILTTEFPSKNARKDFLPELSAYLKTPDFNWTGLDGSENLWILKPNNANRGRGIKVVRDLNEILRHARCPPIGCLGNNNGLLATHATAQDNLFSPANMSKQDPGMDKYLIQKYIERPMVINNYKFDIRQWVVVTSFQ